MSHHLDSELARQDPRLDNFGVDQRNGRGLHEPTPEAMFELVLGTAVRMGLDGASAAPRADFPVPPGADRGQRPAVSVMPADRGPHG